MNQAFVFVCGVSSGAAVAVVIVLEEDSKANMRFTTIITVRVQLSSRGWQ